MFFHNFLIFFPGFLVLPMMPMATRVREKGPPTHPLLPGPLSIYHRHPSKRGSKHSPPLSFLPPPPPSAAAHFIMRQKEEEEEWWEKEEEEGKEKSGATISSFSPPPKKSLLGRYRPKEGPPNGCLLNSCLSPQSSYSIPKDWTDLLRKIIYVVKLGMVHKYFWKKGKT